MENPDCHELPEEDEDIDSPLQHRSDLSKPELNSSSDSYEDADLDLDIDQFDKLMSTAERKTCDKLAQISKQKSPSQAISDPQLPFAATQGSKDSIAKNDNGEDFDGDSFDEDEWRR